MNRGPPSFYNRQRKKTYCQTLTLLPVRTRTGERLKGAGAHLRACAVRQLSPEGVGDGAAAQEAWPAPGVEGQRRPQLCCRGSAWLVRAAAGRERPGAGMRARAAAEVSPRPRGRRAPLPTTGDRGGPRGPLRTPRAPGARWRIPAPGVACAPRCGSLSRALGRQLEEACAAESPVQQHLEPRLFGGGGR